MSRNITDESGNALEKGFAWNFWTTSARASLNLQRSTIVPVRRRGEERIRTYGAYAGDLNGDGYHDFSVPNEDASDVRVFLNDGHGRYAEFSIYPLRSFSFPSTNEGADFNGDGLLDFAVGNIRLHSVSVFFGDGQGKYMSPKHYEVGRGTRGLCILDLNGDGFTDIVTANRQSSDVSILLNRGDGTFEDFIRVEAGIHGETSCAAADFNEDGILDVVVGGFESREIAVLLGDGENNLHVASKMDARGVAWMIAAGDMDGDAHVDVVSANSQSNQFALLHGDGRGNLSEAATFNTGIFPLAIDVGDLDGDGDLDVVTSNFVTADWKIHENDGSGHFLNTRTLRAGRAGSCAVLHDRDRDGDLDMTGIDELDDLLFLFENSSFTAVQDKLPSEIPTHFKLNQSYPNPFSKTDVTRPAEIRIPFSLSQSAPVKLEVMNVRGQKVTTLIAGEMPQGEHSARLSPQNLPAGIYFYRLSSLGAIQTRKIVIFP